MPTTKTTATPAKLRNGDWGCRTRTTNVRRGDIVTITTKSGKSWDAKITKVVWTGNGVAICATESLDRPAPRRRNSSHFDGPCGCPGSNGIDMCLTCGNSPM